jgi:hypothetical protein
MSETSEKETFFGNLVQLLYRLLLPVSAGAMALMAQIFISFFVLQLVP